MVVDQFKSTGYDASKKDCPNGGCTVQPENLDGYIHWISLWKSCTQIPRRGKHIR